MIRASDIRKSFGKTVALNNVSLHVKKQEIYGLVGPDGAGKTTLMRIVCGLINQDEGKVILNGKHPEDKSFSRDQLGYMPQRFSLYGDLTVMENINFFAAMYELPQKLVRQRADEILDLTDLSSFKTRLADNLSGGMKQKLALTCALITRPSMLILDEPTYGVDPQFRKEFWKILYYLNREGMTILVSTPYMDEAELCHVVAFLSQGDMVAEDSPLKLKGNYPHRILEVQTKLKDPDLFAGIDEILEASFYGDKFHLAVQDAALAISAIQAHLTRTSQVEYSIREVSPSMEDVFVSMVPKEVF